MVNQLKFSFMTKLYDPAPINDSPEADRFANAVQLQIEFPLKAKYRPTKSFKYSGWQAESMGKDSYPYRYTCGHPNYWFTRNSNVFEGCCGGVYQLPEIPTWGHFDKGIPKRQGYNVRHKRWIRKAIRVCEVCARRMGLIW